MSGGARDDLYQVAALLDELERALNPLAIDERGELVSTPSVPPALPQAPRGGGAGSPGRGPSSPGPGQSRRSFDADPRVERVRAQPTSTVHDQASIAPAPRRAPPPPGAQRATSTPVSTSEEVGARSVAPERATSDATPRARDVVRAPALPVPGALRAPAERSEPVIDAPAGARAAPKEHARPVVRANDDIAPAIPRARIAAAAPPAPGAKPVVPVAAPDAPRAAHREAPAAPARRSHARANPPRAASVNTSIDRADAPALPGERVAIRRAPAAPAHRSSRTSLRKAETRTTERTHRVPTTGAPILDRAYEVRDPDHTPPPLPRRARERIREPQRTSVPPSEAVDPFETAGSLDEAELDAELDAAVPRAPSSTIWLRGGRMRWTAGPAQLARADRTLSRLVRKRGRRL